MLSYNHIYHAGCAADVFKHTILSLILVHLNKKDKPYTVIDTHAGRGIYNLNDERARKTGEALLGIMRLTQYAANNDLIEEIKPYLAAVKSLNDKCPSSANFYPGSPMIAHSLMRANDSLILCELNKTEAEELRRNMDFDNVHIHCRDGYEAALSLTPPANRRGLLFIDPSYEDVWEYDKASETVKAVLHRYREGIIALWYPVLEKRNTQRENMLSCIKALAAKDKVLDISMRTEHKTLAMRASGMIIINPPYTLANKAKNALPFIEKILF